MFVDNGTKDDAPKCSKQNNSYLTAKIENTALFAYKHIRIGQIPQNPKRLVPTMWKTDCKLIIDCNAPFLKSIRLN